MKRKPILRCINPKCNSNEFIVSVETCLHMDKFGTDIGANCGNDPYFDGSSHVYCGKCEAEGEYRQFCVPEKKEK